MARQTLDGLADKCEQLAHEARRRAQGADDKLDFAQKSLLHPGQA